MTANTPVERDFLGAWRLTLVDLLAIILCVLMVRYALMQTPAAQRGQEWGRLQQSFISRENPSFAPASAWLRARWMQETHLDAWQWEEGTEALHLLRQNATGLSRAEQQALRRLTQSWTGGGRFTITAASWQEATEAGLWLQECGLQGQVVVAADRATLTRAPQEKKRAP